MLVFVKEAASRFEMLLRHREHLLGRERLEEVIVSLLVVMIVEQRRIGEMSECREAVIVSELFAVELVVRQQNVSLYHEAFHRLIIRQVHVPVCRKDRDLGLVRHLALLLLVRFLSSWFPSACCNIETSL